MTVDFVEKDSTVARMCASSTVSASWARLAAAATSKPMNNSATVAIRLSGKLKAMLTGLPMASETQLANFKKLPGGFSRHAVPGQDGEGSGSSSMAGLHRELLGESKVAPTRVHDCAPMIGTFPTETAVLDNAPASPQRLRSWVAAFTRWRWAEPSVALAGFAALCVIVLSKGSAMLEPDDYAYRASIVALSQGHLLLTTAQFQALTRQLGSIAQWVHLPDGRWISEKNPGYPFFAVLFQILGVLRLAPLAYGALGCAGLYLGARRWLGRWGGAAAAVLYCTSGAALTFAWRATMPTFTDASLVAAGAGLLLWALVAVEASPRRRLAAGLGAFFALEGATFVRYTDVVELAVAVGAVLVLAKRARLGWVTVGWWMSTVALFGAGVLVFDALVYGSPLESGYGAGEITFSLSAVGPNLLHMPAFLVEAMPMTLVAMVAVGLIALRLRGLRQLEPSVAADRARDAVVAGVLLLGWAAIWGLYLAYTWTVGQVSGGSAVHVIRFYLPALGLIALLGAWALVRLRPVVALPLVGAIGVLGLLSFHGLTGVTAGLPGGFPGGGGPGGPGGVGGGRPPGGPGGVGAGPPPGAGPPGP